MDMKKKTKWIIIACAALLILLTGAIIITLALSDTYLKKVPYDGIEPTVYGGTQIVSENGLFYLATDGIRSDAGYSYLKSVNDFYTGSTSADPSSRPLFHYYLAKKPDDASYWLIDPDGSEYKISGENLSLTEVALPYLIFTHNSNGRVTALSLRSLQSDLSSHTGNTLSFRQAFFALTPQRLSEESLTYDYLFAKADGAEASDIIFSASGEKTLASDHLRTVTLKKENGVGVCYFLSESDYSLYTLKGEQISSSESMPVLSSDSSWGYQTTGEQSILFFSADRHFSISGLDYDLSTLRIYKNALSVQHLHEHGVALICPTTGEIRTYSTLVDKGSFLLATPLIPGDMIYLSFDGEELLYSSFDDMKLHASTSEDCYVFTSPLYNTKNRSTHSYFFATADKSAVELKLPLESSLSLPAEVCREDTDTPIYLITKNDRDGTPLYQIYTPFSVNTESSFYHAIDFYCHGGVLWALGTSYTKEAYDVLDPVNNVITVSVAAKTTDLSRLSFEYCDSDILMTDAYDPKSGIPVQIIKLNRYEDKLSGIAATRYFAIYRTTHASSKSFQNASLQVKELGQNLLLDQPYRFFEEENVLAIYNASGTLVYRFDDTGHLTEAASTPYYVRDVLTDGADASRCYLEICPLSEYNSSLGISTHYGIADANGALLLSPVYDGISYAENNRFIVSLRGGEGVLEIRKGKVSTLLDFSHATILPLADNGYLARMHDGSYTLYEGDKRIKRNILWASSIDVISTDEDGYQVYAEAILINVKGTLYLHNPQAFEALRFDAPTVPTSHSSDLTDRRAKLISYYDEEGTLVASDLLLPTIADRKNFEENHIGEWYTSPDAQEQTAPVTASAILSSSEHFFRLYPKAEADKVQ